MDKSCVLGDAIKYLEFLQGRVASLEEQAAKQAMETVVVVKKSRITVDEDGSLDGDICNFEEQKLPEIEARVCSRNILIKIQCVKRKGILVKIIHEVENLNLDVTNSSVAPYGDLALEITIMAQMENESSLWTKDQVVTAIRSILEATP